MNFRLCPPPPTPSAATAKKMHFLVMGGVPCVHQWFKLANNQLWKYFSTIYWSENEHVWQSKKEAVNQFGSKRAHNALLFNKPISDHNTLLLDLLISLINVLCPTYWLNLVVLDSKSKYFRHSAFLCQSFCWKLTNLSKMTMMTIHICFSKRFQVILILFWSDAKRAIDDIFWSKYFCVVWDGGREW